MRLIVNADDFGSSQAVNEAIMKAHEQGVLTSASLMVASPAAAEAVVLARSTPTLAVGLHIVLVNGRGVCPASEIPHLVDSCGEFPAQPLSAGLRCVSNAAARAEVRHELAAQFECFAASGLALDHVNSHLHFHVHPYIFPIVLSLAVQYKAGGIRLPQDSLSLALKHDPAQPIQKTSLAWFFVLFKNLYYPHTRQAGLTVVERVFGLLQSGHMDEGYVVNLLRNLQAGTSEIYFHPSITQSSSMLGPNPEDLATLLSLPVRQVIDQRGIQLSTYSRIGV